MSSFSEDSSHDGIMSERTLTIAGRIYAELQSMIHSHGDEVIAELMPLIVSVLEELDVAFQECDDAVQALEELRDELSQCKQEIKRQKQLRELLEEEKINGEDVIETERKKLTESQSQLKILNKSMTLNLSAKKEYIQSLEARMVELEKDHRDLERRHIDTIQSLVKSKKTIREQSIVIETKMSESNTSSIKLTPLRSRRNEEYLDLSQPVMTSFEQVQHSTPISKELGAGREEMFNMTLDQELESVVLDDVELKEALDEAEQQEAKISNTPSKEYTDVGYDENFYEMLDEGRGELEDENPISPHEETGQNLYEELNGVPIGISSPTKHESLLRQASELLESTPRKMSIRSCDGEMNSLLEEKQALEQVRNKLMKDNEALLQNLRDSESTSELNDNKVKCLELENNNITNKITELETTLKRLQTIQHPLLAISPQSGEKDPFEKRFTRCEMDKVIREKNMYKEKYLELQEDLSTRYVEVQTEKGAANEKSKFWNLFSGLFARKKEEEKEEKEEVKKEKMKKIPNEPKEPSNMQVAKTKQPKSTRHFIQGWSLPHEVATQYISDMDFIQSIPAPIYCGPLGALDQERKSLVRCCATADDAFDNRHMTWVCCERDGQGEVFIVDPGNPTEIKQTFLATKSAIICIEFVPEGGGCDIKMSNMQGSESDSDNESGEFEMCSMERHEYLLTCQPTFWLGTQNGCVLIHSAVEEHDTLLARVRLKDSVLQIKCIKTHNVVLAGCADSSIAVFSRIKGGRWDTDNFKVIMLGKNLPLPVSVVTPVGEAVWAAYGGNIAVLSMPDANIKDDFMFTEGVRSLITHMVSVGTGVWLAYRFSPVLTLLDSRTRQPIQQINMEDVLRPVSVSYGFTSTIRISALISFNNLLWIGTSQGALVTIPLKTLTPSSTPYITEPPEATEPMFAVRDEARISLHGHQGAVRYLVVAKYCANSEQADRRNSSASNTSESKEVLLRRRYLCTRVMLSGGEGYISYRDMDAGTLSTIRRGRIIRGFTDHCHMIAWDVSGPRTISN